jgi:lipoprotein-releasing system permease protein
LLSKSSNNAINILTLIATIGVIIGSLALFLVLSVFSGLKSFSTTFLNSTDPDIKVNVKKGKSFHLDASHISFLEQESDIISYSKIIEERAFFKNKQKEQIAHLKGIDKNFTKVVPMDSAVFAGKWVDFQSNSAVVGNGIATKLSLGILNYGEPLKIFVPKPGTKYTTDPSKAFGFINTQTVGLFSTSEELDHKFVFVPLELAQGLLQFESNQIGALEIKTKPAKTASVIEKLKQHWGEDFKIASREEQNSVFYKILNTEKLVAYLIFTLVLIIALFNVIGSIIMIIIDKKKNLKTLSHIGADLKEIKNIFLVQGLLLSTFGLVLGTSLGTFFIFLQNKLHLFMITNSIAYPIEFQFKNLAIVSVTMLFLGWVASKIASSRITDKFMA